MNSLDPLFAKARSVGPQQVAIQAYHLLPVAAVDPILGSIDGFEGDHMLRIVDVVNGQAWLIPLTQSYTEGLIRRLADTAGLTVTIDKQGKAPNDPR